MKARISPVARRAILAGIKPRPGVPFFFEGKWYVPKIVPIGAGGL